MNVLLVSTYELGHQPLGLAAPAAWLRDAGARVQCNDLAVDSLDEAAVHGADLIAVHLPMHTATRLAARAVRRMRRLNPAAHLCFYGLYAPLNEDYLRRLGACAILGGEFETGLVALYRRLAAGGGGRQDEPVVSLAKMRFKVPDRRGLPPLTRYAHLRAGGEARPAGYTEASRGCKHMCRHCPVVPVYGGRFRVVQADVVMEDVRRQVGAGARHISFGDPDFFNGPGHAMRLVRAVHAEFPDLTFDVTIKVEHLLAHARHLGTLADSGCLFVTTAVESADDQMLARLDKGHTRADFVRAAGLAGAAGLTLSPTFIPFTPWTTAAGYLDLLRLLAELGLVANTAPVQLAMRLLVTRSSRLLELADLRRRLGAFDAAALCYPWVHPDPGVERLFAAVGRVVARGTAAGADREAVFARLWRLAHAACGAPHRAAPTAAPAGAAVPHLSEPWYCCAEPTSGQLAAI